MEVKVAVIDMNAGRPNQGTGAILDILEQYRRANGLDFSVSVFDLRAKGEFPGLRADLYLCSGGPGSPFDGAGSAWETAFFDFLDQIQHHNDRQQKKKHVFLICHSFQLACIKYRFGQVVRRNPSALGINPVELTPEGLQDALFKNLPDPFFAADSREWEVLPDPGDASRLKQILALEQPTGVPGRKQAIMAARFSQEISGTQFHPEAGPEGFRTYLLDTRTKATVIALSGDDSYREMLEGLADPQKIALTKSLLLRNFLDNALQSNPTGHD